MIFFCPALQLLTLKNLTFWKNAIFLKKGTFFSKKDQLFWKKCAFFNCTFLSLVWTRPKRILHFWHFSKFVHSFGVDLIIFDLNNFTPFIEHHPNVTGVPASYPGLLLYKTGYNIDIFASKFLSLRLIKSNLLWEIIFTRPTIKELQKDVIIRCQFHQPSTSSFCAHRSWKSKKYS
jgi:hypothetical protein